MWSDCDKLKDLEKSFPFPFTIQCGFQVLLLLLLSRFSRVWLCDPIDGSPPGSPVPGILQARTLEWVATATTKLDWDFKS